MPHHQLPSHLPLRRISTLVHLRSQRRFPTPSPEHFRPLLPCLWSIRRPTSRKLSTAPSARAYDTDFADMGKEGKGNFQLKTPKGTRDWSGKDVVLREQIFSTLTKVFKRHGGVTIDTPVFELKDTLTGKYGEDSKLIYDLANQGGEICSLRYDLTVPFARFLAQNSVQSIKRYHVAKVYRRDQPAMTKGRMREFYQCDFDIAGQYDLMLPDAEILRIIHEVFEDLPGWKGKFTIKVNHRKVLDGIFQICGVPTDKIRTISSAVDKLDKSPWEEVRREMVEDKGLDEAVADKIWEFVKLKGGKDVVEKLQSMAEINENESAKQGCEELALLCKYLEIFDVLPVVSIDMSLARGLDYYTGLIYEVVTEGSAPPAASKDVAKKEKKHKKNADPDEDRSNDPTIGVGSVAAGGRYDELVGMFSGKPIPCVGISFGVDRIFSITKARLGDADGVRATEVDVFVMAFGSGKEFTGLLPERMEFAKTLWDAGIRAEYMWKAKPKFQNQFKAAETTKVPWAVILGEDELRAGKVAIKEMGLPADHPDKNGVQVEKKDLVEELQARFAGRRLPDRTVGAS
ncbi:histidyl-tRNA synthetase mitochondrial precursor [Amniculicola lignicola CBS 123094]|uniref:Histidine--tRNA ligase, mitochondrial n=1 Tax=Amniculicola lignicola CBS 123094 TaxID=1392246 RepID=A0A6A5X0H7_9PLEO|nr:histidyl-tRNA synthetase mitochondrial precursor [Amniculicola lignicola CBS 123094]